MKMRPPRKVPVVSTAARTGIIRPRSVTSPVIFCRIPLRAASQSGGPADGAFPSALSASAEPHGSGGSGTSLSVVRMSVTVSMSVYRLGVDSTVLRASCEYRILSACARGACTAGPLLLFSIRN